MSLHSDTNPISACCISGNEKLLEYFLHEKLKKDDETLRTIRNIAN